MLKEQRTNKYIYINIFMHIRRSLRMQQKPLSFWNLINFRNLYIDKVQIQGRLRHQMRKIRWFTSFKRLELIKMRNSFLKLGKSFRSSWSWSWLYPNCWHNNILKRIIKKDLILHKKLSPLILQYYFILINV